MNKFTHLHLHTEYSLRDAITPPEGLMKKCAEHGMPAVGVTDHGTLMGMWSCAKYAKKYGVKLIPGNEVYVVPDVNACRGDQWKRGKSGHLVLIAADQRGWENLLALTTRSNLEGFYGEPRVDYAMLEQHKEGLFAHTACLGGVTAKAWRAGQPLGLAIDKLHQIFGERLSLEIQLNTLSEQEEYNAALMAAAKSSKVPLIATVDSHYLNKTDSHKQDLVFALGRDDLLDDPNRRRYPQEAHSVEVPDEVITKFVTKYGEQGRAAVARTVEIADNCSASIQFESKKYLIPSVSIDEMEDYEEFIQWKRSLLGEQN